MQKFSIHPRHWSVGGKITVFTFALVSLILASLTTLTSLACVWAAGKVFRTGILMQGKAASLGEMARWVMAK